MCCGPLTTFFPLHLWSMTDFHLYKRPFGSVLLPNTLWWYHKEIFGYIVFWNLSSYYVPSIYPELISIRIAYSVHESWSDSQDDGLGKNFCKFTCELYIYRIFAWLVERINFQALRCSDNVLLCFRNFSDRVRVR